MKALLFAGAALVAALAPVSAQAAPPAAVVSLAPVPEGKLTDAARPRAYRLDLTVDPAKERFSGHVEIDATLARASRFIDLHGRDLAMHRAVARVGGRDVVGTWTQLEDTGVVRLTFPEALPAGPLVLAFDYDAPFGAGPSGLFRVKVGKDWYAWSQFESIDARAAFPGFDEPGFKVPFSITLRTPAGLSAVSNAPELGARLEQGMLVHRFRPTLPLPTYLVALMVGPFAKVAGAVPATAQRHRPLPLRVISTKPNAAELGFALGNSKTIVRLLEGYFGQPFPFPKLDQITSPIMPGAMENAGADLYNDGLIVMGADAPVERKRNFGMVVAHELSHQWFGDLVSPAWWDDIWLNESFANWMGYRIGNAWRPDLNIAAGATAEGFAAMQTDSLLAGRPIRQSITRNAQIDAAFDAITYGKGGHVVSMIAAFMGDDKFRAGVRRYMATHRYGNASSADFFKAMAEVSGDPRILPALQSFTDQQGVPLLTFTGANGHYTVQQSRYARFGTVAPVAQWGVPLCVRRDAVRSCSLLTSPAAEIEAEGTGPLMPNAGGTGYYRFELPDADWTALIAQADRLPGGEALALADSVRASYQAGRSSATRMAALARQLVRNPDSHAAAVALNGLEGIRDGGFLDEPATAAYRRFVGSIYAPRLAVLGFNPRRGAYARETAEKAQARIQVVTKLATVARDEAVRQKLASAADMWLGGSSAALDPAYLDTALGVWIEREGLAGAKRLFDRALASEDPVFRPAALDAIGSSGKAEVAAWVLDGARDPRLRQSERHAMLGAVIATPGTRDQGYAWMKGHFAELLTGSAGVLLAAHLPAVLNGFCSVERANDIARDLRPRLAGKTAEMDLERTIERVRSCGVLKQARGAEASREMAALK